MFTGVNSGKRHHVPPSDNQQSPRSTGRVLLEAIQNNPLLVINADAVLTLAVPSQRLKMIARQCSNVSEHNGRIQPI